MQPLSKIKLKDLCGFKQQKQRSLDGVFVAEGEKLFEELIQSSFKPLVVCATVDFWEKHSSQNYTFETYEVSEKEMERLTLLSSPSPVWCLVEQKESQDNKLLFNDLILVLDNLKDPGNMGNIIRTAEWFGIQHIVCSQHCVSMYNPKTVQAAMGSVFRVNIIENIYLPDFLKQKPKEIPCYGAVLDGKNMYEEKLTSKAVLIMGSESHGISAEVLPFVTHKLLIPKYSTKSPIDSLNAAIATAIFCAEIRRR